jgi:hypothetical protein
MHAFEVAKYLLQQSSIAVEGTPRPLGGCLPRTTKVGSGKFPAATIQVPFIAKKRSQWIKTGLHTRVKHVYDQNGYNSCCPNAGMASSLIIREIQGNKRIILSPASVYKRINGGRDQGAAIEDCLEEVTKWGALPVENYPINDWKQPYPANADEIAAGYRDTEFVDIPNIEIAGTVLSAGFPLVVGVTWSGGGGHAICLLEVEPADGSDNFTDNTVVDFPFVNSWGTSYGDNGIGKLPEPQVAAGIRNYGCWAPASAFID